MTAKISWLGIPDRIKHELNQSEEEGHDVLVLRDEWNKIESLDQSTQKFKEEAETFYGKLEALQSGALNNQREPSDWNGILEQSAFGEDPVPSFTAAYVEDRILGGWLGRSAGCLLGKPVEKTPRPGIKELLTSNNTWPLSAYITENEIPGELLKKYPWNRHSGRESLKENIICMPEDDDMNYPMINLSVMEQFGTGFTTQDVIAQWMSMLPVLSTFTAERVAYVNHLNGLQPPETATVRNPYREWIGAQIRADLWGWISPAQPSAAAQFAWRDARLSHVRNGIYGEIFFAAAIAAAFKYERMTDVLAEALTYIPSQSKFADAVNFVFSLPVREQLWDDTVDILYNEFGKYHWVHTINNAALAIAALLSSNGDFEKGICNVVMGGWDTDSNGATVGSVLGTMLGAKKLPAKWIAPLNNKIRSSLSGYDNSLLSDLAHRTATIAKYKTL